ncbi:MAG TPA: carboxylesterase/lipase family protein [Acidimicrobiales bacterium]|nr:carboxylesterase/lipase family protein [Acidimicrobiales bacterium]
MSKGVVTTRAGVVRGIEAEGVWSFRAIPYAAAPLGGLRFRPPQPAPEWAGVRDASVFGPVAPQPPSGLGSYFPGDPVEQSEDCLFCNVWTPALGRGPRPVMVFVHGGAFCNGSGSGVMYRAERLAARGVVVVTFNYRLGALGFLAHPALADDTSGAIGNWGLHDQIAALRWVRDNIGPFGGDPGNVTVFGESAGAMSICDLLAVPKARGLFHRVIAESGATLAIDPPPAARIAERLSELLGHPELSREALTTVPVDELLAAQIVVNGEVDAGIGLPFQPVVDRGLFPSHPEDLIVAGSSAGIDLLLGSNRDEFKLFSFAILAGKELTGTDLEGLVGRYLRGAGIEDEGLARDAIAEYRRARRERDEPLSERALLDAIVTDWIFRVPQLRLADAHRKRTPGTYVYLFDWPSPFAGGGLGACHGIELPFVFGTVHEPIIGLFSGTGEEAFRLSDEMQESWVAFARSGDPSNDRVGAWSRYEATRRTTMRFGLHSGPVDAPHESERQFWERRLGRYGVGGPIEGARRRGVALVAPEHSGHVGT